LANPVIEESTVTVLPAASPDPATPDPATGGSDR
jgi:hypothetical protein